MKAEELINHLGYSIESKPLIELMKKFELDFEPVGNVDFQGNKYGVKSRNKEESIILTFVGFNRFSYQFGKPKWIKNLKTDELILTEIDFDNEFSKTGIPFSIALPFGLVQGDSKEIVMTKLERKPKEKMVTNYGFAWWFQFSEYRVLTALNKDSEFIWLRIMKLTLSEINKIEFLKELRSQKKNINPENEDLVKSFVSKMPTQKWRQRMKEGDDLFTETNIKAIEEVLRDYVQTLAEHTKAKKASNIYSSVKKVVKRINKLNNKYNDFIETMEREELCAFIDELIQSTGFKIKENVDVTEDWREW